MTFANRNQGGSGVYARSLLAAMRERADVVVWTIEGPRRSDPVGTTRWLMRGAHRKLQQETPKLLHCPSFVAPWRVNVPYVVTVHDSAVKRYPGDHPFEWRAYTNWVMPERMRAAARVITGSNFGRTELIESYGLDSAKVVAIPYGLDARYLAAKPSKTPPEHPVMLFPGAPLRRKNLELVLKSMAEAPESSALAGAELLISGATPEAFRSYAQLVRALGLEHRVRWLGTVPFVEMPTVMASASVLVYPSLYEGFGFPPLEAMAAGTPVVASNRGSLPEVLGDAAILIDPNDQRAFTDAVEAVLTKPELRKQLSEKGASRARSFTWENCADKTVELYHEVLGGARVA